MSDDAFKVWLAAWLGCMVGAIGLSLPVCRRTLIAWLTYWHFRHDKDPKFRAWLWRTTLDYADGKPTQPTPEDKT
jgi:hypothetical protein